MKKIPLIMTILLLVLVVSGCNIPSGTNPAASPQPSAQPTTIPTQAPAAATGPSFAGKWDTDYGNMTLTVTGNKVTGTYDHQEGMINGTVTGSKLTGTWAQAPTRAPPDDAGDFVFTLSSDGNSFEGLWRYGHSDNLTAKWNGFWYGNRIA